ncbi:MAG: response regulator transcription factor [bacterium]
MTSESTYRIVLADDHAELRQSLKKALAHRRDCQVVAEAGDGTELLRLMEQTTPDLVILDITMPNLGGIEATRRIKTAWSDVKVLIMTVHREEEYLQQAISAGAEGYLLKEEADTELFTAIETVRKGRTYVSPGSRK